MPARRMRIRWKTSFGQERQCARSYQRHGQHAAQVALRFRLQHLVSCPYLLQETKYAYLLFFGIGRTFNVRIKNIASFAIVAGSKTCHLQAKSRSRNACKHCNEHSRHYCGYLSVYQNPTFAEDGYKCCHAKVIHTVQLT